jgi:hypothetical protein
MAAFTKFQKFVEDLAEKVHNLGSDTLTVALCAAANAPVATNSVLTDLTQISYTNLSSRALTIASSAHTTGTYKLTVNDLTLTASGGAVATFRYVVIYNDTAASDQLICFFDLGQDITLANGESITLDFDGSAGLLTLA